MKNERLTVDEFLANPDICPNCGIGEDMEIIATYYDGGGELQQNIQCNKCNTIFYIGYIANTYGIIN